MIILKKKKIIRQFFLSVKLLRTKTRNGASMEKRILFILLFILQKSFAQIPNQGFEYWSGGSPDEWQTTNIPIVPPSIIIDNDAHSGTSSVKGIVVSDSYNHPFQPYLGIYGSGAQGFVITQPYIKVSGWYKLFLNPNDRFLANVRLYDSNQNPVADGKLVIESSVDAWSEFNMNINYYGPAIPVTCSLFFTITDSGLLSSGQTGSYFILDDLSMSGSYSSDPINNEEDVSVFPNPAHSEFHVNNMHEEKHFLYYLYDATGKVVIENKSPVTNEIVNTENFLPGVYILNVFSDDKNSRKKIVVE